MSNLQGQFNVDFRPCFLTLPGFDRSAPADSLADAAVNRA